MSFQLQVIVVGLGGRGLHWVRALSEHPAYSITGYVEPVEANRLRAIERLGLSPSQIVHTLTEALQRFPAAAVVDVTPPGAHVAIAREAFAAGLHVLGEKPLSDDFAAAQAIVAEGRAAGRRHMITQNYRFGAQPRTTRKLLADGKLGRLGQCDLRFYIPWADIPGSHYVTQPFMLLNDMMVHHFDLLRYVLGVDPVRVHAVTWNHPWGWHAGDAAHSVLFQFPDGLMATHIACGCAVGSQTGWNGEWRIEGERGSLDWGHNTLHYSWLHRTHGERVHEEVTPLAVPPPEHAILDEFVGAILDDREPECSAADNLRSLAMVFGAIRSAQEGGWVTL